MKNHILSTILIIIFVFSGYNKQLHSQTKPHTEEITIIAPYQPSISDAIKIHLRPNIEAEEYKLPSLSYSIVPVKLSPDFQLSPIEPIEIEEEPFKDLFKNYLNRFLWRVTEILYPISYILKHRKLNLIFRL